ncbi:MAG: precorrin-3B C(17)-methyltransferase [Huintestinicola sp.]
MGILYVVGFGAGNEASMTIAAKSAIEKSNIVIGYTVYTELVSKIFPEKEYLSTPMRHEEERVRLALEKADLGNTVSLVCSGDSGVYGMASLAFTLGQEYPNAKIEIIPGVTAALSGAALLGAPLTHDFAVISLSDLLTPWEKIELRLECAARADLSVVLYNPSSKKRSGYLLKACEIMLRYKDKATVCGIADNIGREGERVRIMTLEELKNTTVDMFSTVFVGNSQTCEIGGKMVTPRGYAAEERRDEP